MLLLIVAVPLALGEPSKQYKSMINDRLNMVLYLEHVSTRRLNNNLVSCSNRLREYLVRTSYMTVVHRLNRISHSHHNIIL